MHDQQSMEKREMIPYIHQFINEWNGVQAQDLHIQSTIGLTNKTYIVQQTKCSVIQVKPERIIFRFYGDECEGTYLNREREVKIISQLSEQFIGPKFYGANEKIRIEEYWSNRVLESSEMLNKIYYRKVAQKLAQFHQAIITDISQEPSIFDAINPDGIIIQLIRDKLGSNIFDENEHTFIEDLKKLFTQEELMFNMSLLQSNNKNVCFSHNDLLANNILITNPNEIIQFIDFEYSAYNFRGYDFGNYFVESQFDYSNPNPPYFFVNHKKVSFEIVEDFIKIYALTIDGHISNTRDISEYDETLDDIIDKMSQQDKDKLSMKMKEIFDDYLISRLFSDIFWAGWAIHMSHTNDIRFDYIKFAYERHQIYKSDKIILLQKQQLKC